MEQSVAERASRARRSRGYAWEDALVKRIRGVDGWRSFRLGSPSVALPDIMAVNNSEKTLMIIEAKSGTGTTLQVPSDQLVRCARWTETLCAYEQRKVVLAFKFLSKKRVGTATYTGRGLREFYKEWNCRDEPVSCVCTYEGGTYALSDGKRSEKVLDDFEMPFRSRWARRAPAGEPARSGTDAARRALLQRVEGTRTRPRGTHANFEIPTAVTAGP